MDSPAPERTLTHGLPSQRELLASILTSISRIPLPSSEAPVPRNQQDRAQNPLRLVPPAHRHLFTTLHVLFPPLLLPALDLLDRGLVTRVVLDRPGITTADGGGVPSFFTVRSATPPRRPRRSYAAGASADPGREYAVHLTAWNCTCAAFGFAAAAAGPPVRPALVAGIDAPPGGGGDAGPEAEDLWADEGGLGDAPGRQFGGLSLDGILETGGGGEDEGEGDVDGGVPCCKHLLACLLADRWAAALGRYVVVRRVSREEMVGIVADL